MSHPDIIVIKFFGAILIVLLIFQYCIMLTVGLKESKTKQDFWYNMIPYSVYAVVIKSLIVSFFNNIKSLYSHYKSLK